MYEYEADLATVAALIGPFGRSAQPAVYDDNLDAWRRPDDPHCASLALHYARLAHESESDGA
jgi:hypothetical protein